MQCKLEEKKDDDEGEEEEVERGFTLDYPENRGGLD